MNYTENARESAAKFLETVVDEVKKLIATGEYGHYFARVVHRTNHNVRSIEGFLPILAPDDVFLDGEFINSRNFPSQRFQPGHIGIPITNKVWTALTVYWTQEHIGEEPLPRQATFEQVSELWLRVAERYRSGDLDSELLDEDQLLNP